MPMSPERGEQAQGKSFFLLCPLDRLPAEGVAPFRKGLLTSDGPDLRSNLSQVKLTTKHSHLREACFCEFWLS